jgi:hypothetical protein
MSGAPPASGLEGEGAVASAPVLRRLQLVAAGYALVLGTVFALLGAPRRGLVLTGGAAVSIVALRSLEGVVRRLSATGLGPPPGLGWRYPLRLLLLVVLVSTLILGGRDALALVLGVSAVPAALLVEAALQLTALRRERGGADAGGPTERAATADRSGRLDEEVAERRESESEP